MRPRYIIVPAMLLVLAAAAAAGLYWATDGFRLKAAIAGRLQDALGKKVRINGDLALKLQIPLTVSLQDLQIQNAAWGSAPAMAQIAQLEAQIGIVSLLRGNIRIAELQLTGTDFFLERSKTGGWNFEIQRAQAPAATAAVGRVQLNDSRLVYWRAEDKQRFQIEIARLAADIGRAHAPAAVSADLVYQKVPLAVDGSLQPAGAAWDATDSIAVHMQVSSGSSSLTVDGSIRRDQDAYNLDVEFKLQSDDLSQVAPAIGYPLPKIESLRAAGHFQNKGLASLRFTNLNLTSGQNRIAGKITVQTPAAAPRFEADLNAGYLAVGDFVSGKSIWCKPSGSGSSPADVTGEDRVFSRRPLQLNWASGLSGDVRFGAQRLLLPYVAMDNVQIRLKLEDGRLKVDPIKADLGDGSLRGQLEVAADGRTVAADARIQRLDLAAMLEALGAPPSLKGEVGLDFNLQGRGRSPAAIMAGLSGQVTLVMQEGQIAAKYLENAEKLNLKLTDSFLKLFAFTRKKREYAEINCFVGRWKLTNGIADVRVLVFDTERVGVMGDGSINLKTERLNISLKPIEKGGIGFGGGKVDVGLGGIADLFKLGGTLAHPSLAVDKSDTAISAAVTLGKAIGGTLLFGPVGLAAALVDADFDADNPCISALKEAGAAPAAGSDGDGRAEKQSE